MTTTTTPVPSRLRPGLPVLRRSRTEIQIGIDPGHAAVLGLPESVPESVMDATIRLLRGETTHPGERARLDAVIKPLAESGLLEDARAAPTPPHLTADSTAGALRGTLSTVPVRARSVVAVHGAGRLAVSLACLLAAAGVGHVHVSTTGTVTPEDTGTGLLPTDVGAPRSTAIQAAIRRVDQKVRTHSPSASPDLVLLTDAYVPDRAITAELVNRRVPHLPVRSRPGVGVIGPLVVPTLSSCLHCADLWRAAKDACWPRISAQLAGRAQQCDLATAQATAGLAAAQVLAILGWLHAPADQPVPTWNTALELDSITGSLVYRPWDPHPSCRCSAAAAAG
ncbi:hypothetical protein ACTG9Q_18535 [Actinokineospora sp. 24-640]